MSKSPIKLRYLLILFVIACAVLGPFGLLTVGALLVSVLKIIVLIAVVVWVLPRLWRYLRANF